MKEKKIQVKVEEEALNSKSQKSKSFNYSVAVPCWKWLKDTFSRSRVKPFAGHNAGAWKMQANILKKYIEQESTCWSIPDALV